jgi:hypothetical protein
MLWSWLNWFDWLLSFFGIVEWPSFLPEIVPMDRLEAVVICVDYADYLEETLPYLLPHVDDLVVVTTPDDLRTKTVCHRYSVRCLETRCFHDQGEPFNKARGINFGLAHLKLDGWVLHIDADTVLPPRTRYMLAETTLDARKLYGADRVHCVGRAAWDAWKARPWVHPEWRCLVHAPGDNWKLGSRIVHMDHHGYCPIGFFQLWHPAGSGVDRYPEVGQVTAEHSDVRHAIRFDRARRQLLPEIITIHLETKDKGDNRSMGQNWSGRKTPEFNLAETPYWRMPVPDDPVAY